MGRKYTGYDATASGKRAGTERFVQLLCAHFGNGIWNNGTWVVRNMNTPGKAKPSVHSTGRAADLSWRANKGKGFGNYEASLAVPEFLTRNAEALLIEELHDYHLAPFGRGWRCDRSAWKIYQKNTIGSPGGDWYHVEIAPTYADDPAYYERIFAEITGGTPAPAPSPAPAAKPAPKPSASSAPAGLRFDYPGQPVKVGSKGDAVKLVQAIVGGNPDGRFGPMTRGAVVVWQKARGLTPDGIVGPETWKAMFG